VNPEERVLLDVIREIEAEGIPYMLTGSTSIRAVRAVG
jgi:hypothetical protein